MPQICDMGQTALLPLRRKVPKVPKASTLPLDHWSRCVPFRNRICVNGGSHNECAVLTVATSSGSDPIRHVTEVTYGVGVHGSHSECMVESSWNVMAHGDAWEGKWRGNRQMEWVASTLHTTLEHGVSSITTTDAHTSAAGSRLNWHPRRFKWNRPFCRMTKSGFCECAITFKCILLPATVGIGSDPIRHVTEVTVNVWYFLSQ
jgi:hypothetical protein